MTDPMAREDTRPHDSFVAVAVAGRRYHVAFEAGKPCSVRLVLPDGAPCTWWLVATLPDQGDYAQAAREAAAFIADFQRWSA